MSEERKAFLAKLKNAGPTVNRDVKTDVKKSLVLKTIPPKERSNQNERLKFLSRVAGKRKSPTTEPRPSLTASDTVVPDEGTCRKTVDFSLSSLHEFRSRGLLTGGKPQNNLQRKRPNYDNRLRRLNKAESNRVSLLSRESNENMFYDCFEVRMFGDQEGTLFFYK